MVEETSLAMAKVYNTGAKRIT